MTRDARAGSREGENFHVYIRIRLNEPPPGDKIGTISGTVMEHGLVHAPIDRIGYVRICIHKYRVFACMALDNELSCLFPCPLLHCHNGNLLLDRCIGYQK